LRIGTIQNAEGIFLSPVETITDTVECSAVKMVTTDGTRYAVSLSIPYNCLSLKRRNFCKMLMDHHEVFNLEDSDRGETNLAHRRCPA